MATGHGERGCAVFDVDGTLLDTNYLHVAAWWEAFREHGLDVRSADIHRALGRIPKPWSSPSSDGPMRA